MAQLAINVQLSFITLDCYRCGVVFAVDGALQAHWQRDKTTFYCPNGHGQSYTENEADRLKRQLAAAERDRDFQKSRAETLDKKLTKEQKAAGRLKKRLAAGVCPCCQRTVTQLAKHMSTKHPDYVIEAGVRLLPARGESCAK